MIPPRDHEKARPVGDGAGWCFAKVGRRLARLDDLALVVEHDGDGLVAGVARHGVPGAVGAARQAAHGRVAALFDLRARDRLGHGDGGLAARAERVGLQGIARHGRAADRRASLGLRGRGGEDEDEGDEGTVRHFNYSLNYFCYFYDVSLRTRAILTSFAATLWYECSRLNDHAHRPCCNFADYLHSSDADQRFVQPEDGEVSHGADRDHDRIVATEACNRRGARIAASFTAMRS